MMRRSFDRELAELSEEVRLMGSMVDYSMQQTQVALAEHDFYLASIIRKADIGINAAEKRIEQLCIRLLALQQPIASDLRHITSSIRMVADLERIGDQCADICEILCTYPESFEHLKTPHRLITMLTDARKMLRDAMKAFLEFDVEAAESVRTADDKVDLGFSETVREMCQVILDHNVLVTQATDYMFMAKYIERMADHATNIAEWAIYAATAELPHTVDESKDREAIRAFLDRAEAYGRAGGDYDLVKLEEKDSFRKEEEAVGEVSHDPMMPGIGRRVLGGIDPEDKRWNSNAGEHGLGGKDHAPEDEM